MLSKRLQNTLEDTVSILWISKKSSTFYSIWGFGKSPSSEFKCVSKSLLFCKYAHKCVTPEISHPEGAEWPERDGKGEDGGWRIVYKHTHTLPSKHARACGLPHDRLISYSTAISLQLCTTTQGVRIGNRKAGNSHSDIIVPFQNGPYRIRLGPHGSEE